jgi:hypothetical protein
LLLLRFTSCSISTTASVQPRGNGDYKRSEITEQRCI